LLQRSSRQREGERSRHSCSRGRIPRARRLRGRRKGRFRSYTPKERQRAVDVGPEILSSSCASKRVVG
jgi:hypothetical protein